MPGVTVYWFKYWCRDGKCKTDMTPDGLNLRYRVFVGGKGKEFHEKSALVSWLSGKGLEIGEMVCLQPPI